MLNRAGAVIAAAILLVATTAYRACGVPVHVDGFVHDSVVGSGGSLGVATGYSLSGNGYSHGPPFAPNHHSYVGFTFEESPSRVTLSVTADQLAPPTQSMSIREVYVYTGGQLLITAIDETAYGIGGTYLFDAEAPGTGFTAKMTLSHAASGTKLFDWQRTRSSETSNELLEIGDFPRLPDDVSAGSPSGLLTKGQKYELAWAIGFANPIGATASGKTVDPLIFDFIRVPEPSNLAISAMISALVLANVRGRRYLTLPSARGEAAGLVVPTNSSN